jgi:large subunit ribosomal protein L6
MSKIGKVPVAILEGVSTEISGQKLKVKGPLGELSYVVPKQVSIAHDNDNNQLVFAPANESKEARALWGTARSHVSNLISGVKDGFKIEMELKGTGYRAKLSGQFLDLSLGYSHDIKFAIPSDVKIEVPSQTEIIVSGVDKQKVGQIAAEIRKFRPPEPYKGKGVHRKGDFVRRKEGKKK